MSKKKNAFYFYMLDFKEQQLAKGVKYRNLEEVAAAASPSWTNANAEIRNKFVNLAKEKQASLKKYTSTGVCLENLKKREEENKLMTEYECYDIKCMVKLNCFTKDIQDMDIFLIDVNQLCIIQGFYMIGEFTILRFNLTDGIKDSYHEIINPGYIPRGYGTDIKYHCKEYGLEIPSDLPEKTDYTLYLPKIIKFLKQNIKNFNSLPPIFAMPDKTAAAQDFCKQICKNTGDDLFRVYRLDTFFYHLVSNVENIFEEVFQDISWARTRLERNPFKYTSGFGCEGENAYYVKLKPEAVNLNALKNPNSSINVTDKVNGPDPGKSASPWQSEMSTGRGRGKTIYTKGSYLMKLYRTTE